MEAILILRIPDVKPTRFIVLKQNQMINERHANHILEIFWKLCCYRQKYFWIARRNRLPFTNFTLVGKKAVDHNALVIWPIGIVKTI